MSQKQARVAHKEIVAYPTMPEADYDWINLVRETHNQKKPYAFRPDLKRAFFHFHKSSTRTAGLLTIEHIKACIQDVYAFDFTIRYAVTIDEFEGHNIVLLPMRGLHNFCALSSLIHLRILLGNSDSFYHVTPHIHIAYWNKRNLSEAKARMNRINQHEFEIKGRIEKLNLKEWLPGAEPTFHEFPLKSRR